MAASKNKSNHHQQKTVSFRLPEDLMAELRDLAKRNRRTLSGELHLAIEEHLRRHGLAKASATNDAAVQA